MSRHNPVPTEPEETHLIGFTAKELKFVVAGMKLAEAVVLRDNAIMTFKGETVSRDEGHSFSVVINKLRGK